MRFNEIISNTTTPGLGFFQPLHSFVFDYFLHKFGRKDLADTSAIDLVVAVHKYGASGRGERRGSVAGSMTGGKLWISMFAKLLSGEYPPPTAEFFLCMLSIIEDCPRGVSYPAAPELHFPYWLSLVKAEAVAKRLFWTMQSGPFEQFCRSVRGGRRKGVAGAPSRQIEFAATPENLETYAQTQEPSNYRVHSYCRRN